MDALSRMPRAQAIEGAMAFQGLSCVDCALLGVRRLLTCSVDTRRERLKTFLRPHADGGVTITKELIDEFFAREKEARA